MDRDRGDRSDLRGHRYGKTAPGTRSAHRLLPAAHRADVVSGRSFPRFGNEAIITTGAMFVLNAALEMPHFNGSDLTTAIRGFEPALPIVIITGGEIADEALAGGRVRFLPKRVLTSELRPALEPVGIFTAM